MLPYLDEDLAGLAEHARRTSRLAGAATVRARADRRRRRRRRTVGAVGVLLAAGLGTGVVLGRPAPQEVPPAVAAPPVTAPPAQLAPAPGGEITAPGGGITAPGGEITAPQVVDLLDGDRMLAVVPIVDGQPILGQELSMVATGRLDVPAAAKAAPAALFLPGRIVPGGSLFLMRTGAECLQVKRDSRAALLVTTACDTRQPDQQFAFDPGGAGTFRISVGGLYLSWFPKDGQGLTARPSSDGITTTFALVDRGPARPIR